MTSGRNRIQSRAAYIFCLAAVVAATSFPVRASQGPVSTVSGTVVDSSGAAVGNAKITLINDAQGFLRETVTSEDGLFRFPFVLPGTYTILADMPGFTKVRVVNLVVGASVNSRVDIALTPKGSTEIITIEASQARADITDSSVKYSMTQREVERKPVVGSFSGRTVIDSYSLYLPGLYPGLTGGSHGEGIVVNGARPFSNVFMIDGGDNNDYEQNHSALPLPNPDAVQEVSIVTSNYKADLGGGAGGVFNIIMKSGTDAWHGNIRYLPIDTGLYARQFFGWYRNRYRYDKFGAQVGGPLTLPRLYDGKGRTHFFFDYEGIGISSESAYPYSTIPEAFRRGDFSSLPPYDPDNRNGPQ
ncbi:MAG TPA: carboxypeptidase regulatory-like domain-containing protein, partial [Blastocatellia bacterium]|nr:carboxypeptidase regulatory-like domain-containing protein [Blastocatellia bacterium]